MSDVLLQSYSSMRGLFKAVIPNQAPNQNVRNSLAIVYRSRNQVQVLISSP